MNRIVIIGNGFDLAHKLETGYLNFIRNLLFTAFEGAINNQNGYFEGKLLTVYCRNLQITASQIEHFTIKEYLQFDVTDHNILRNSPLKVYLSGENNNLDFSLFINHYFVSELLNNFVLNKWVDIEAFYYQYLKKVTIISVNTFLVDDLLVAFYFLNICMQEYLKTQKAKSLIKDYTKIFTAPLESQMRYLNRDEDALRNDVKNLPERTLFLNFNYTQTLEDFLDKSAMSIDFEEVQIHGSLYDIKNPIIFGYGDESDKDYEQIENLDSNKLLTHFKSFGYFLSENYTKLLKFIEEGSFEVYTIGHSCGLSDRVLLKSIFEHDNCKFIKIHYFKPDNSDEDDYTYLSQNLSRHFSLNRRDDLRKKIINKQHSCSMPQMK